MAEARCLQHLQLSDLSAVILKIQTEEKESVRFCLYPGGYNATKITKTMNSSYISGTFMVLGKKSNQICDNKPQAITVITLLSYGYFLWFDLKYDWWQ